MAGVQVNRTATGVYLPAAVSNEIWSNVQNASVIQQVARRVPITGAGVTVPIITGDAIADWVAETGTKKVSRPTLSNKTITPYKLALIVPFSNEFRRDLGTLYSALSARLPNAIAKKFDQTCLGYASSPGSNFDTLDGIAEVEFTGPESVAAAAEAIAGVEDAAVSHFLVSPQLDFTLGAEVDSEGRYLHPNTDAVLTRFGGSVVRNKHVYDSASGTVGIAGDFASFAVWGAVGGIEVSMSDQAVIKDTENGDAAIYLWQQNMFAIRVEATLAFALRDDEAFVRFTGGASS